MNSNWFMILQIKSSPIVIVKLYLLHVRLSNKFVHFPWVYESCANDNCEKLKNWFFKLRSLKGSKNILWEKSFYKF